jgi:hypothetical protein
MPIRPEFRAFYGHEWRTVTRPRILKRDRNRCVRCGLRDVLPGAGYWEERDGTRVRRPARSRLEVAHLDGNASNCEDSNLASLCHACHRANDYAEWARRSHETRSSRKDRARPLLEASA